MILWRKKIYLCSKKDIFFYMEPLDSTLATSDEMTVTSWMLTDTILFH